MYERLMRRVSSEQRGQSLVEFAITIPILTLMMIGVWTIGRAGYDAELVRELAIEGGKMGAIDRVQPDGHDSFQMDSGRILKWMNTAASNADPSIADGAITPTRGNNGSGLPDFSFDSGASVASTTGQTTNKDSSAYNGIAGFLSGGNLASILNPDLHTMEIKYSHNTGIGPGYTIPILYNFDYQGYMMIWIPFGRAQG